MILRAVYAVYGKDYFLREAEKSARSLRLQHPQCEIIVFTLPEFAGKLDNSSFNNIETLNIKTNDAVNIDFALKIAAIQASLTSKTIFLDSDTYICGSLDPAWSALRNFDVMACHAPYRRRFRFENYDTPDFVSDVPRAYVEFNTGVLFLRNSIRTRRLVQEWKNMYRKYPLSGDQYLFMHCLYHSKCKTYVLPSEYNYRFTIPGSIGDKVRILHAHHHDMPAVAQMLNADAGPRSTFWREGQLKIFAPPMAAGRGLDRLDNIES